MTVKFVTSFVSKMVKWWLALRKQADILVHKLSKQLKIGKPSLGFFQSIVGELQIPVLG